MSEPDNRPPSGDEQAPSGRRKGQFQPGQSGNPGGRPKGDIARAIRERTKEGMELVDFLLAVVHADGDTLKAEARMPDRVRAAELLLERGWGKATQPMEHSGAEGGALVVEVLTYPKAGA